MPLCNCEINLILTWSEDCVISSAVGKTKLKITDTKFYAPVATLSTKDNVKLLEQLKSSFKRTISCNKYHPKFSTHIQNKYLDFLVETSFQDVNRLFGLCLKKREIKKYVQDIIFQK